MKKKLLSKLTDAESKALAARAAARGDISQAAAALVASYASGQPQTVSPEAHKMIVPTPTAGQEQAPTTLLGWLALRLDGQEMHATGRPPWSSYTNIVDDENRHDHVHGPSARADASTLVEALGDLRAMLEDQRADIDRLLQDRIAQCDKRIRRLKALTWKSDEAPNT